MRWLCATIVIALAAPAAAQTEVDSPGPDHVSVTVYRAPNRDPDESIDRDDPQGYALITETRTVTLPPGPAVIRFAGVAGNIFPETALVSGLPAGVREKNLDADLLSPRSLYDRALGRRVMIRRTNPKTGVVTTSQAVIRSGADGAALIEAGSGIEALRCSGLPEQLVYPELPPGLSAKPVLSVQTDGGAGGPVTLTLSYLAGGFDWQADYVVTMRPDGRHADLFAWLTLASNDVTSFADAGTQVVAGKPKRDNSQSFGPHGNGSLNLSCWPTASLAVGLPPPPPPPPPPPMAMAPIAAPAMDIVVTGMKRQAIQEELGDLKLYRVPEPVTVASQSQKQVALLQKQAVPVSAVYVADVRNGNAGNPVLTLRAKNRTDAGLGLPLPAGKIAVFEPAAGRPILLGEAAVDDKAIGEDVEYKLGPTRQVHVDVDGIAHGDHRTDYVLTTTNANPWPVAFEARIAIDDGAKISGAKFTQRNGRWIWSSMLPANGTAKLSYRVISPRDS